MTIQEYIDKQYNGSATWFMEEVNQKNHVARIAGVVANMDYLAGRHKVLGREDCYYKGKVLKTRIPSVLGSSTNIANVSSVAMQILYAMAQVNADETKKWLNIGFRERFERFKKILSMQGISVESDVDVIYNVSMPVATTEMIANLKALQEMGAISKETIMEKSDIVSDVEVEKKRLSGENVSQDVSQKVDNPSK